MRREARHQIKRAQKRQEDGNIDPTRGNSALSGGLLGSTDEKWLQYNGGDGGVRRFLL